MPSEDLIGRLAGYLVIGLSASGGRCHRDRDANGGYRREEHFAPEMQRVSLRLPCAECLGSGLSSSKTSSGISCRSLSPMRMIPTASFPPITATILERPIMQLSEYFERTKGVGVLATTDLSGQVNQAIYAAPYFPKPDDDGTCALIMTNRLSHNNVFHNPSAAYLFLESGDGYVGKRLSLTVIEEESDPEKIKEVRRHYSPPVAEEEGKYLVYFHVEGVRPLVGNAQHSCTCCGK